MEHKTITFFNNKGGVGKTTTVYHLAWMLSELGKKVVVMDLDPQSNLTAMFLEEDRLESLYALSGNGQTVLRSIKPVTDGLGYKPVLLEEINENIALVSGDLSLSAFEDKLSDAWLKCLNGDTYSFMVTSIFNTIISDAAKQWEAQYILLDVGPNLGAINRAVLIASDHVILPVASDLFSLQGIKNLGETMNKWQKDWSKRLDEKPTDLHFDIPRNKMKPLGYILMQYTAKEKRPVKAYLRWANRIPDVYKQFVLSQQASGMPLEDDPNCIGHFKHYHSLAPMSMEAKKTNFPSKTE